jgi:hypothetical protein
VINRIKFYLRENEQKRYLGQYKQQKKKMDYYSYKKSHLHIYLYQYKRQRGRFLPSEFLFYFNGKEGRIAVELLPIGVIHSPYKKKGEAPHQGRARNEEATLCINYRFKLLDF